MVPWWRGLTLSRNDQNTWLPMAWPGQHPAKACEAKTSLASQGQEHVPCCQNWCTQKGAYTLQIHNPKNPSAPLFKHCERA